MTADRWTICPRCAEKKYPDPNTRRYMAEKDYNDEGIGNSMREDFEIWTNPDGILEIIYSCSCYTCGLSFRYKNKVNTLAESDQPS